MVGFGEFGAGEAVRRVFVRRASRCRLLPRPLLSRLEPCGGEMEQDLVGTSGREIQGDAYYLPRMVAQRAVGVESRLEPL